MVVIKDQGYVVMSRLSGGKSWLKIGAKSSLNSHVSPIKNSREIIRKTQWSTDWSTDWSTQEKRKWSTVFLCIFCETQWVIDVENGHKKPLFNQLEGG